MGRASAARPPHFLTADQERTVRRALLGGATRTEAAELAGITRQRLDTRLRDQLADIRVGQGRREQRRQREPDPTPEEIAIRAAAIRETWSEEEANRRRSHFSGPLPDA